MLNELNADIFMAINGLTAQCSFIYIFCYFANNVTLNNFDVADIVFFSVPWYKFRLKDRQLIRFWIQRAQIPFYLDGLAIIRCSMETFLMVN